MKFFVTSVIFGFAFLLNSLAHAAINLSVGLASNFSEISSSNSNPYSNHFREGVELALSQNTTRLDLRGYSIKLKEFDYGLDPSKISQIVASAAESNVVAVLGYNYSSHALIAAPFHEKFNLPMITPSATATRLASFKNYVHQTCFNNSYMGQILANIAKEELKAKNILAIVVADCAYCEDLYSSFEKHFSKNQNTVKVIRLLEVEDDHSNIIKRLKTENFDAIFVPNHELTSARIISSLLKAGVNLPFLGGDGWGNVGNQFFAAIGDKNLNGYSVSHWHNKVNSDKSRAFIRSYKAKFGKEPNDTSVLAFDSMNILIEAILKSEIPSRKNIERQLSKATSFVGATGAFRFSTQGSPAKSLVVLRAKKNRFEFFKTIHPKGN